MKVLALGGSGDMGRHAVLTAIGFDFVDEVVVADRDADAATRLAKQCGAKARAAEVDARDVGALRALMSSSDVVLNTVGPFYRFGVPILETAIDAGCHYFDINDDWEPTLEMLERHGAAEAAGVTAVIGLGASPGISNLLAVRAMRGLDTAHEVLTGWSLDGLEEGDGEEPVLGGQPGAEPSAALVHWMHQCSGKIRVRRDGAFTDVRPVEEREIDYPGIGRAPTWSVGHPEALTLPLTFSQIQDATNLMTGPRALMDAVTEIRDAIDAKQLRVEEAAALLAGPMPDDTRKTLEAAAGPKASHALPPLFALAIGERGGKPHRCGALVQGAPPGGMGGVTGVPLALGLPLLHEGHIDRRGVFAPEAVIDPDRFFDALAPYCAAPGSSTAFGDASELVLVTDAPGPA